MYDPKTGKGTKADTYEQHLKLKEMGYGHSKPAKKKSKTSFTDTVNKRMGGGF